MLVAVRAYAALCSHPVEVGSRVNPRAGTITDASGVVTTIPDCTDPIGNAQVVHRTLVPSEGLPAGYPTYVWAEGVQYLGPNGVAQPGVNTLSKIATTFQVPWWPVADNPLPVRLSVGMTKDIQNQQTEHLNNMSIVLSYWSEPEFGIPAPASWYLTAVVETGTYNADGSPNAQMLFFNIYPVLKGDWVDAEIAMNRHDPLQNDWILAFKVNGGPVQWFQYSDSPDNHYDLSWVGSITTDSPMTSCAQFPYSGQMSWWTHVYHWDENLSPGDPTIYVEETDDVAWAGTPTGPQINPPYNVVPPDCPAWPLAAGRAPGLFQLGWLPGSSTILPPPVPPSPPVPAAPAVVVVVLAAGLGVAAVYRLRVRRP
jgi:hypothetical protein